MGGLPLETLKAHARVYQPVEQVHEPEVSSSENSLFASAGLSYLAAPSIIGLKRGDGPLCPEIRPLVARTVNRPEFETVHSSIVFPCERSFVTDDPALSGRESVMTIAFPGKGKSATGLGYTDKSVVTLQRKSSVEEFRCDERFTFRI